MFNGAMNAAHQSTVVLLWDVDGTLVAQAPAPVDRHMRATARVLGHEARKVGSGRGKTDRQIVEELMVSSGVEPTEVLVRAALDELDVLTREDLNRSPLQAIPGARAVLQAFHEQGVRQTLLTGNTPARARDKLVSAGLDEFFTFADGYYGAEARDRFHVATRARSALGHQDPLGRKQILVALGDTPLDVRAGRHAEMLTVAIATGTHDYEELVQESPDLALRDFVSEKHMLISYVVNLLN